MSHTTKDKYRTKLDPSGLTRANQGIAVGFDTLISDPSYPLDDPHQWLYVPHSMIKWDDNPSLNELPAFAVYEKASMDKMFSDLNIGMDAQGIEKRQNMALYYPMNINSIGGTTKARKMKGNDVFCWFLKYWRSEKGEEAEPDTSPLHAELNAMRDYLATPDGPASSDDIEQRLLLALSSQNEGPTDPNIATGPRPSTQGETGTSCDCGPN